MVSLAVIGSPASSVAVTADGSSLASLAFCSRSAGASTRAYAGAPCLAVSSAYSSLGDFPVTALISLASRASRMPSLSVVQVLPSRVRNEAPADSSPPKPMSPVRSPGTNHLKPTGTSTSVRPRSSATRLIIEEETRVLPMPAFGFQPSRCAYRYWMATAR